MRTFRHEFLKKYSELLAEEKWHHFNSDACQPDCLGWNAWSPFCQCGSNYCIMRYKVVNDEVQLFVVSEKIIPWYGK